MKSLHLPSIVGLRHSDCVYISTGARALAFLIHSFAAPSRRESSAAIAVPRAKKGVDDTTRLKGIRPCPRLPDVSSSDLL